MSKLIKKNRKVVKSITLDFGNGPEEVQIVKPTLGDRLRTIEAAQLAGDVDKDGQPTSPVASARLAARMIITCVYSDGQPAFGKDDVEALLDEDFFEMLAKEVGSVFSPDVAELGKQ